MFELWDNFIPMVLLRLKNKKGRLGCTVYINLKNFIAVNGRLSVEIFFNQQQHQVQNEYAPPLV